ncbi:MAG: hypothetical protein KF756_05380 [Acidobacteria bacterium]|nr:hypothetical protein [Acidobacteriota bacterium]
MIFFSIIAPVQGIKLLLLTKLMSFTDKIVALVFCGLTVLKVRYGNF